MDLKEFRTTRGLTQAELAKELGFSKSYYSKIENDERQPSFPFMSKLKNRYPEVSINDIFFRSNRNK